MPPRRGREDQSTVLIQSSGGQVDCLLEKYQDDTADSVKWGQVDSLDEAISTEEAEPVVKDNVNQADRPIQ